MRLARVIGNLVSTEKHPAYEARKLLLVQPLGVDAAPLGRVTMAIDYVGAGPGDYVLIGAAPGLASQVFHLDVAPINDLVMGIVDRAAFQKPDGDFGNDVPVSSHSGKPGPSRET